MTAIRRLSAAGPLQVAIDSALQADAAFVQRVGDRCYSLGTTPKEPTAPYVEYGESTETPSGTFGRGGNDGTEEIVIMTKREQGKIGALAVLGELQRVLETGPVTIEGHQLVRLRVVLVTMYADPDGLHIRTIARCPVLSWTNAPTP